MRDSLVQLEKDLYNAKFEDSSSISDYWRDRLTKVVRSILSSDDDDFAMLEKEKKLLQQEIRGIEQNISKYTEMEQRIQDLEAELEEYTKFWAFVREHTIR